MIVVAPQQLIAVDTARDHCAGTRGDDQLLRPRRGEVARRVHPRHRRAAVVVDLDETFAGARKTETVGVVQCRQVARADETANPPSHLAVGQRDPGHPGSVTHDISNSAALHADPAVREHSLLFHRDRARAVRENDQVAAPSRNREGTLGQVIRFAEERESLIVFLLAVADQTRVQVRPVEVVDAR